MVLVWDTFDEQYPEQFTDIAVLLGLQEEPDPKEIDSKLHGAMKGALVKAVGEEDGRFFLDTIWGIKSTLKLSHQRGSILGMWLRSGGEEKLPGIVEALHQWLATPLAPAETIEQAAVAMGAEVKPLTERYEPGRHEVIADIADSLRLLPDSGHLEGLQEAPASVNFFASLQGFNAQWTLRDWSEADLLVRADLLIAGLTELGAYAIDRYGNPIATISENTITQAQTTTSQPRPRSGPMQQPAPDVTLVPGEEAMHVVKIVVGTTKKGDANLELFGPNRQWADLYYNFGNSAFLPQFPEMRGPHTENPLQFEDDDLMPSLDTEGRVTYPVYTGSWIAVWKNSDKLTGKGVPYKDIVAMYPNPR